MPPRILLIKVGRNYYDAFIDWAANKDYVISSGDRETLRDSNHDTVLCVYQANCSRGLLDHTYELLSQARSVPIVILSPEIEISHAAQIIEAGARDVIRIPASPTEVLARAVARARRFVAQQSKWRLIGESPKIQYIRHKLRAIAPLDSTVLITGETGTGKGLAARLLHELSPRSRRAYVHADCSGLAGSLIESELFGHERGAFTGAIAPRIGRFEAATGGTIFLDEIGELNLALQAKLLRVLQDQVFERVGSNQPRMLSARVIAATNRDVESDVRDGRFRQDLFFRLNVLRVKMPPLRERQEDLAILVQRLLEQLAARLGVGVPVVPKAFMKDLESHDWPGNVRELMNVLERFLVRHHAGLLGASSVRDLVDRSTVISTESKDRLTEKLSGTRVTDDSGLRRYPRLSRPDEKRFLESELAKQGGNISRLARKLGVARSTLRYRISLHKISR